MFVNDLDAVKYTETDFTLCEHGRQEEKLGIAYGGGEKTNFIYVIPLDSDAIKSRIYTPEKMLEAHTHIYAPLVDVISPNELDEEARENYFAYIRHVEGEKE